MKRIKIAIGFLVFGFLLSLIIGLCTRGVGPGLAFLRAFIFALVFGGVGFAVALLFDKFVDNGTGEDSFGNPSPSETGTTAVGQNVNILTPDEPLPVDNDASQFYVGNKHQMLNSGDYYGPQETEIATPVAENAVAGSNFNSSAPVASQSQAPEVKSEAPSAAEIIAKQNLSAMASSSPVKPASTPIPSAPVSKPDDASSGFVPVALTENAVNISSVEATSKNDYTKVNNNQSDEAMGSDELDALPDIQELQDITAEASAGAGEDISSGSGTFSSSSGSSEKTAESITEGQDTAIIAKAISTLLAKDK